MNETPFHIGTLRVNIVLLCVGAVLSTIAFAQYGWVGVAIVAVATVVMMASVWITAWIAGALSRSGNTLGALLVGFAIRMVLPLALALGLASGGVPQVRPAIVLYLVPLYLAMLLADTMCLMHAIRERRERNEPFTSPAESLSGKPG